MKTILDTNIWYNIGSGKIKKEVVSKYQPIYLTYVNIVELCFTHNLINHFKRVQNASLAALELSEGIIFDDPINYMREQIDIKKDEPDDLIYSCIQFLNFLGEIKSISPTENQKYFIRTQLDKIHGPKQEYTEMINKKNLKSVRDYINEKKIIGEFTKGRYRNDKEGSLEATLSFLDKLLLRDSKFDYLCLHSDVKSKYFELFISVFNQQQIELGVSKRKIKENDWNDMLIMAYVQPGDKFATYEKHWFDMVKNLSLDHYLIPELDPNY